ncbi:PstS family phosphate ABC transporter substrate-binding protein [Coprobacter sp.]
MKIKRAFCFSICAVFVLTSVFTACNSSKKKGSTETPTSGIIKISADQTFEPIIDQEINVFEGLYPTANIIPVYTDEVEAITALIQDSVRLAVTTRRLSQEEIKVLNARKLFPKEVKIATDGVALIVNKQNPDTLITMDQLRRILTGEVTDWKQIYPKSKLGKLQLVFDNPNSSTVRYAIDSICAGKPLSKNLNAQDNNENVIDYVSKVPNAIGVIGASWIGNKNDSTRLSFSDRITVMGVSRDDVAYPSNSYQPYQAYLAMGLYPLTRDVYIITTDPKSGLPSGFTTFVSSDKGQRIILKTGIVPATQAIRIVNVRENL